MRAPIASGNMRIGLMGGSFDPPHAGHMHISLEAIKRLKLDQIWWLVSPGNPLKEEGPWPLEKRLQQCVELAEHPKLKITALEAGLGSPYTADTLRVLTRRFRTTRFVWIMGADNMASVHHWKAWRQIFEQVPIAVMDRPGERYKARYSKAAHVYKKAQIAENQVASLAQKQTPAWGLLSMPLSFESSTGIRQKHRS